MRYSAFFPLYPHKLPPRFLPVFPPFFFAGILLKNALQHSRSALVTRFAPLYHMKEELTLPASMVSRHAPRPPRFLGFLWVLLFIDDNHFEHFAGRIKIFKYKNLLKEIDTYVRNNPDYANRSAFLQQKLRVYCRAFNLAFRWLAGNQAVNHHW
ncbi:type II toxin-antitoxin system HicB family antitoxin [Escherichia coli]|nr:type II toxin-antitoxin system HicB family antitoxin [Escherichia coli]WCQ53844.1 type II toxin-antitoxin system HicB family antitoxin [Escherichia coli]